MRYRLAGVLGAVIVSTFGFSADASADFHPACANTAISASVTSTVSSGSFIFTGTVRCDGADVSITELSLYRPETGAVVASAPAVSCTGCTGAISTAGSTPADPLQPGHYYVRMRFTARNGTRAFHPQRTGKWFWYGPGGYVSCSSPWSVGPQRIPAPRCLF